VNKRYSEARLRRAEEIISDIVKAADAGDLDHAVFSAADDGCDPKCICVICAARGYVDARLRGAGVGK
jgi:hypothetical protein